MVISHSQYCGAHTRHFRHSASSKLENHMHLHTYCFCVVDILAWHMPPLGDCGVLIANLALNSYRGVLANWVNFKRDYAEAGRRGGIMSCIAVIRGFYISIFLSYHRSLARTHIRQYCCSNAVLLKANASAGRSQLVYGSGPFL